LAAQRVDDEELSSVREANGGEADFTAVVLVSNVDVIGIEESVASLNKRGTVFGQI
jgi:hypothetical protein